MAFRIVLSALPPGISRIVAVNFPNTVTISGSLISTFIFSIKSPARNVIGKIKSCCKGGPPTTP